MSTYSPQVSLIHRDTATTPPFPLLKTHHHHLHQPPFTPQYPPTTPSTPNTHQQLHLLPIPTNNSIYSQYSTKLKNTPNYTPSDTLHPLSHQPPDQSSPNRHCTS